MTKDDLKTNYESYSFYTDILASYKYWTDTKGKYQTGTGTVIVGVTKTDQRDKLVFSKKGAIVDADAAKIASASIKNGRITVTAKSQAGMVYLWVMDTGDVGTYTCCPVTVKMAPTALSLYNTPNIQYGVTKKYTGTTLELSESTDLYLYPAYVENKEAKKTEDATYTAAVTPADCFTVERSAENPEKFTVRATGVKNSAKTNGTVTILCNQNGKKVYFSVAAVNTVKKITLTNASGLTLEDSNHIKITSSKTEKTTGTLEARTERSSSAFNTTNAPKIYAMRTADGYNKTSFAKGKIVITKPTTATQKKIAAAIGKDKKTITVSAVKGAPKNVTTYFLLVYNVSDTSEKKGYEIFSVTTE